MLEAYGDDAVDPIQLVDIAEIPGGGQLRLLRRGGDFSIRFGEDELMGSQVGVSEQALAVMTAERLTNRAGTVLIGGLGMGFTLGAALDAFPLAVKIVVAELVPKVVTWASGALAHMFGDYLDDPRVTLEVADVHDVILRSPARFDAIMLDVDNGPDGLISLANDRLYCNWGLRTAYTALRPGGMLAVWSAYTDTAFGDRLDSAGFDVDEVNVPVSADYEDGGDTIWFASKPG